MIVSPPAIALVLGSVLLGGFTLYAAGVGMRILFQWDRNSAGEKQLALERKTFLVSTIVSHVTAIELVSLFMFVAMVDRLHPFFTGAMCAAGTLNVNAFGYTTLAMKISSFLMCGIWFIVNYVDNLGYDYPLIRFKYAFLLVICLMLVSECIFQIRYFLGLQPRIITSCCSVLFGTEGQGIASHMAHLPAPAMGKIFYAAMGVTLSAGIYFGLTGRYDWLYGILSVAVLPLSLAALISCFCLYFYELPTHHCPFCLLQREYKFAGYFLYAFLLAGAVAGAGMGIIGMFRGKSSLKDKIPQVQKRLCRISLLAYGSFSLWVSYPVVFSDFKITGY